MNKLNLDVVMMTWNSNGPEFNAVLDSIIENCPLCHFIVVDRFSTDGTIEKIVEKFPEHKLRIVQTSSNLGAARAEGVKLVDTEWFAYVDSDVELCENWFQKIRHYLDIPKLGAVEGVTMFASGIKISQNKQKTYHLQRRETIGGLSDILRNGFLGRVRGYAFDVVIRTKLVRDWQPPWYLTSMEDYHLCQHVLGKGYDWIRVGDVFALHHWDTDTVIGLLRVFNKKARWAGAGIHVSAAADFLEIVTHVIGRLIGSLIRLFQTRRVIEFIVTVVKHMAILFGWILWRSYLGYSREQRKE